MPKKLCVPRGVVLKRHGFKAYGIKTLQAYVTRKKMNVMIGEMNGSV